MRKILGVFLSAGCLSAAAWAGGSEFAPATVSGMAIDGLNLEVALVWSGIATFDASQLVLRDEDGNVVVATPLMEWEGNEVVVLKGAFQGFGERGLQYHLAIEDGAGAPTKGQPFFLALDCPDDQLCDLRAVPGIYSEESLVVEEDLDSSFDTFGGSRDILSDVLSRFPEQRGAVYAFSWQMNRRFPRGGACSCIWMAIPVTYMGGPGSIGAAHRIGVLPNAGDVMEYETSGESRLTLRLRCFRATDTELMDVAIGQTGEGLILSQPRLKTCSSPCTGTVDQSLSYEGDYYAEAGSDSSASAMGTVTYEVDGNLNVNSEAQADAGGPAGPSQSAELNASSYASGDQPQKAILTSTAWVSADSGAAGDGGIGYAESSYLMVAQGSSSCAVQSSVTVTLGHTWPPLNIHTTNITLIIGN